MSEKSSTFAVDFQSVHNHKLLSRMKPLIHYITLSVVLCLAVACDSGSIGSSDPVPLDKFTVASIPSGQLPSILADTVTPPSNPMAPADLSSYPTFAGVLTLLPFNYDNINLKYVSGIQLLKPISYEWVNNEIVTISTMYLLDNGIGKPPVRFDYPLLQSCVVGDTICVTGIPVELNGALGIIMYYVQPQQ